MNKHLIMAANNKGYVVRNVESRPDNAFGKADIITIENSTHRIHFTSNVLHGTNYCQIIKVEDLYKRRTYTAHRYFHKFIHIVSQINGDTFIGIKTAKDTLKQLKDEGIL